MNILIDEENIRSNIKTKKISNKIIKNSILKIKLTILF